jgi:hypothetical protein
MTKKKITVINTRPAGPDHQVITVTGGNGESYRREPCKSCPWVIDNVGEFPAEAFRHSASTAYDMAETKFSCHESGASKPATCAGFLLRGGDHNLSVRLSRIKGIYKDDVTDGGKELYDDYRSMAIDNGVEEDDPILKPCR